MPIKRSIVGRTSVKVWTDDLDNGAETQLKNLASLPFIHSHIAAMPDVHWGMGATIGSVIPSKGAIVPAAVGVDIGCGMNAVRTTLRADQLPDSLRGMRLAIEAAVPHGRTDNGGRNDKGGWRDCDAMPDDVRLYWAEELRDRYNDIVAKHPKARSYNSVNHLGTLGTGNHFIEVCLDEEDQVWVMLHSGSRGAGNRIGSYFIERAKREMERWFIGDYLPDANLSYLVENTELFDDYIEAVGWAQDFAAWSRGIMMQLTLSAVRGQVPVEMGIDDYAINCHHNYVERENHFGANVWVTRKGAIRARKGDLGIIPGSMGAKSFIVRGKGEKMSFCSCSHGAGRKLGRREAQRMYTAEDLAAQTQGIECPKDASRVDEIPAAYKSIDEVMANQTDLVEVVHTLRQIVNVKG